MTAKTNLTKYRTPTRHFIMFAAVLILVLAFMPKTLLGQPTLKKIMKAAPEDEKDAGRQKTESKATKIPLDDLKRGAPRTSVRGFFQAVQEMDYEKAAQYMDLRNLPSGMAESDGPELARLLNIVIDQTVWIDYDLLSDNPKGHINDGFPSYRDLVCRIQTPKKEIEILMQRVPRGDGVLIWKFSNRTVAQIPRLYEYFGYGHLINILPEVFFDLKFMEIAIWVWIYAIVLLVAAYFAALIVTALFTYSFRRMKARLSDRLKRFIAGPVRFLLAILIANFAFTLTNLPVAAQAFIEVGTLFTIVITWTIIGLCDFIFDRLSDRFRQDDQHTAATVLLPPLKNATKIMVIIIAILMWLDNIGFSITTILAGLGVGSIALALALQKSVENMIGAITLYISKPVRVGDFCKFGDTLGTVEEIGLRTTRVRTLGRTVVSVPNGEFMNLQLNNFTQRDKMWYHPEVSLRYETTPDQIRSILTEIRKHLASHPKVLTDSVRVRFKSFGAYSLDLDIFAYIDVRDYDEYLAIAEELNLGIMDIVTRSGSSFAFPSQTTYLERGEGSEKDLDMFGGFQKK